MFKKEHSVAVQSVAYQAMPPVNAEMREIERACARLFSTADGKMVLSHLQAISFCRALSPDSSDAHLRHAEGQRAMVATILRLIDRGRAG